MNVVAWKGIGYAAATAGDRRWRTAHLTPPDFVPEPGGEFGPSCPQEKSPAVVFVDGNVQSEDCLSLNIWRAEPADGLLPVMVWIHGGAYVFGGSAEPRYDGSALAASGEVVVVTINYRLGAFGFLEGGDGFDSNVAMHDVLTALEWLRRHVADFGGDAGSVTVFGESSGAGLVAALMASPMAAGLFHRAIIESSPLTSIYSRERAAEAAYDFFTQLGIHPSDRAALCKLTAEQIVAAQMTVFARVPEDHPGTIAFTPVVGDDLLPEHPIEAFAAGRAHPVPLIIGTNRNEATLFKFMRSPLLPVDERHLRRMFKEISIERPDVDLPSREEVLAAYAGVAHRALYPHVARDLAFRMPTLWAAAGHSRVAPTFVYRFDHTTPMLRLLGIGAAHGTEVAYVFGDLDVPPGEFAFKLGGKGQARTISERIQGRWRSFAATGDPGWPVWTKRNRGSLIFDTEDHFEPGLDDQLFETWGETPLSFD